MSNFNFNSVPVWMVYVNGVFKGYVESKTEEFAEILADDKFGPGKIVVSMIEE